MNLKILASEIYLAIIESDKINHKNDEEGSFLNHVVNKGLTDTYLAIIEIEKFTEMNATNIKGETVLHLTVNEDHMRICLIRVN